MSLLVWRAVLVTTHAACHTICVISYHALDVLLSTSCSWCDRNHLFGNCFTLSHDLLKAATVSNRNVQIEVPLEKLQKLATASRMQTLVIRSQTVCDVTVWPSISSTLWCSMMMYIHSYKVPTLTAFVKLRSDPFANWESSWVVHLISLYCLIYLFGFDQTISEK